MDFDKPVIELFPTGFKAYFKKKDQKKVMQTLKGKLDG